MLEPVNQLMAACKTLEEFRERLPQVIAQLDPTEVAELLAQGMFASTLAGRTGAA